MKSESESPKFSKRSLLEEESNMDGGNAHQEDASSTLGWKIIKVVTILFSVMTKPSTWKPSLKSIAGLLRVSRKQATILMQPPNSFINFNNLPTEVQVIIFKMAARQATRIIELTNTGTFEGQMPALLTTCHTAREEALKVYHILRPNFSRAFYFNPNNDTLLMKMDTLSHVYQSQQRSLSLLRYNVSRIGRWIRDGKVKSFAIKPELCLPFDGYPAFLAISTGDEPSPANKSLLLARFIHCLMQFSGGLGEFTMITSSSYDIKTLKEFFDLEDQQGWFCWIQNRATDQTPLPIPTGYEEESEFYSRFDMTDTTQFTSVAHAFGAPLPPFN